MSQQAAQAKTLTKERRQQKTALKIKKHFGKNAPSSTISHVSARYSQMSMMACVAQFASPSSPWQATSKPSGKPSQNNASNG